MKAAAIINPQSGSGRTLKVWRELGERLTRRLGGLEIHFTERAHHATELARYIATEDFDRLIVVGGDGTLHEVVNGLFDRRKPLYKKNFQMGIINGGRGCDFVKSLGYGHDPEEMLALCSGDKAKTADIGFVDLADREVYYINSSSYGMGGDAARSIQQGSAFLPASASYLVATLKTLVKTKAKKIKVTLDDNLVFDGKGHNVFVCNGRYSGGGMLWAPNGRIDDGFFDVLIIRDINRAQLATLAPHVYLGTLDKVGGVSTHKAKSVVIESAEPAYVELDGETYLTQIAKYTILPQVLPILVK